MTDIVVTRGLVKRYPGTLAVAGWTSPSARARSSASSGPNGAGKTTTLRILATLLDRRPRATPRSPAIDVRRNPDAARRVLGFMPDVFGVYDDMKVWEYLDFFARCYGIPGRPPAADDRRPARARRPRRQARRLRPEPVARHAAAAVPRPHARPRPAGAPARRARLRPRSPGPGRAARAAPRAPRARQDDRDQQPHPPRARGAVHGASRSSTTARCSPTARSPTSSAGSGSARCSGSASSAGDEAVAAARAHFAADPRVASATSSTTA